MAQSSFQPRVHLEIESRLENVELAQLALQEALAELEVADDECYAIGAAVREAVANAIRHGNGVGSDKPVMIDLGVMGSEVIIRVSDRGPGFDPERLPDPRERENRLRPGGRGILIMREFMDRIEYSFFSRRGTELTLRKVLGVPLRGGIPQQEEKR